MKNKSIAIVIKHLAEGGAQRSAAMLSLMLDKLGYKVTLIALYNKREFAYKGDFVVLNNKITPYKVLNKYHQFLNFKKTIKNRNFDFIIDFRGRTNFLRELIIYNLIYRNPRNIIFTVRESKLENYFPRPFFAFKRFYKKAFKIMVVSKGIEDKIKKRYSLTNVITINNGIDFTEIDNLKNEGIDVSSKFILSVGRLVQLKQFNELIEAYSKSTLITKGIKLYIIGEGKLENELNNTINTKMLVDFVKIVSFQNNPYKYMGKAEFLVLQSKREGFPNVLLESLACGTPVVSFDCETGPRDIVAHGYNGLLVENQNFESLKLAMNKLVDDEVLYAKCKKNAKPSVTKFDMDNVANIWGNLLQK